MQTYESNDLDWLSFIFNYKKRMHSNVTMCQYQGAISGKTLVAIKIIANGHTYEIFYMLDETIKIISMCIHGLMMLS
jgi:hypothetical protein